MVQENSFGSHLTSAQGRADLAREITDGVIQQLPEEKLKLRAQLDQTAQEIKGLESNYADGRGQAIASIPPLAYHRWNLLFPGCWKDRAFVDEFLQDNRECLLPGYKPKPKPIHVDMGRGNFARAFTGADLYWHNKERVNGG